MITNLHNFCKTYMKRDFTTHFVRPKSAWRLRVAEEMTVKLSSESQDSLYSMEKANVCPGSMQKSM